MAPAGVVRRARGDLPILASAVAFSSAGYFARLIQQDVWTVLFWRGIFGGLFVAACSTISTICFINTLGLTTVADVNIIDATELRQRSVSMLAVVTDLIFGRSDEVGSA